MNLSYLSRARSDVIVSQSIAASSLMSHSSMLSHAGSIRKVSPSRIPWACLRPSYGRRAKNLTMGSPDPGEDGSGRVALKNRANRTAREYVMSSYLITPVRLSAALVEAVGNRVCDRIQG